MTSKQIFTSKETSSSSSLNDDHNADFTKFLDEPLSTSSNVTSNAENETGESKQIEKVTEEDTFAPRHTWLKHNIPESSQAIGESSSPKNTTEIVRIPELRPESPDPEERAPKSPVSNEDSVGSSKEDEESLSFQLNLKKAIDHSLQSSPSDDGYSDTFEGFEAKKGKPQIDSASEIESLESVSHSEAKNNASLSSKTASEPDGSASGKDNAATSAKSASEQDTSKSNSQSEMQLAAPLEEISKLSKIAEKYKSSSSRESSQDVPVPDKNVGLENTKGDRSVDESESSMQDGSSKMDGTVSDIPLAMASLRHEVQGPPYTEDSNEKEQPIVGVQEYADDSKDTSIQQDSGTRKDQTIEPSASAAIDLNRPLSDVSHPAVARNIFPTRTVTTISNVPPRRGGTAGRATSSTRNPLSRLAPDFSRNTPAFSKKSPDISKNISSTRGTYSSRRKNSPSTRSRGRGGNQPGMESEMSRLKKQLAEQESLLSGFQIENEKLYNEVRTISEQMQAMEQQAGDEKKQLAFQLANAKEKIHHLEFGKRISDGGCPSTCKHSDDLKKSINENLLLKQELITLKAGKTIFKPNKQLEQSQLEEEITILKSHLAKTEQLAAELQLRLTRALHSEKALQTQLDLFARKQTTSQTVEFLENQIQNLFEFQETRDENVKKLLDDIYKQQGIMKMTYQDAIAKAEEEFQEKFLLLQTDFKHKENIIGVGPNSRPLSTHSKSTQCNWRNPSLKRSKVQEQSQRKIQTKSQMVQCYFGDDPNSNTALENKELKLRVERLTLQQEDYKKKINNCLEQLEKSQQSEKKHNLCTCRIYTSTEIQQQTAMESQQILLEQIQRRLEYLQEQWERQVMENSTLKRQLDQTTTLLIRAEEKLQTSLPELQIILTMERKIAELEKRHSRREEELTDLQYRLSLQNPLQLTREVSQLQEQVVQKNGLLNQYRQELDTIIAFLYRLQSQQNSTVTGDW